MKQKKENVKVKSVRRESKFLCGEIEGRKWDTQIFWFDESFLTNFPNFKFISAGDWVQITYKEENVKKSFTDEKEERKKILSIENWRVSDMRNRIIKILKDAIELSDKTRKDYATICNKYSLTREGKETERLKAVNKIAGEMARKTEEGLTLFDKKIEEISREEQKELNEKNTSLQYQQMITEKAMTLETLGENIEKIPAEYLRQYLQEFANDPVALMVMESSMKGLGMKAFGILPPNNLGARQKILTQAKGSFETAMENLALIDDAHDMSKSAATNNFLTFLECENDDFSKPMEEVWNEVNEQGGGECDGRFPFKFNRVR